MLRASPGSPLFAVRLRNRPAAPLGRCCLSSNSPPLALAALRPTELSADLPQISVHELHRMRKAIDSISQDLLDLSSFLKVANTHRQHLLNESNNLQQLIKRRKANSAMKARQRDIKAHLQALDRKIRDARQNQIPTSSFFIHLKRLHGRLPIEKSKYRNSPAHSPDVSRHVTSSLKALLALPNPRLLEELAHSLLMAPLPISQESFLMIIRRLSSLRFASAARSIYHNFMVTGIYPVSASSISVLLKITISAQLRAEFQDLESLLGTLQLPSDEYVHSGLVVGNLKFKRKDMALSQFSKMTFLGYQPNLQVLTALLDYSASMRFWRLGCQFWRAIVNGKQGGRFRIDVWAYHAMWRLCTKCYQRQVASQILQEAVHDGYRVEEVIHHRRLKYKSLPLRNTNKAPAAQDILHAFKSLSAKSVPVVPTSASPSVRPSSFVTRLKRDPRTASKIPKPDTLQPKSLSSLPPSLQARRKLDAIYINKARRVGSRLSNRVPLDEPEIPTPAEQRHCSSQLGSTIFNLEEEILRDAIQERSAMEALDWFAIADEAGPSLVDPKSPSSPFRDPVPTLREDYVGTRLSLRPRLLFRRRKLNPVVL